MKLRARLYAISLGPMLVLAIMVIISFLSVLGGTTKGLTKTSLKNSAVAAREIFDQHSGKYHIENGKLFKGEQDLSSEGAIFDSLFASTGTEFTFFYGDTRTITTIKDESGKRAIGSHASSEVISAVLNKGEEYFSDNLDIKGSAYYAYYVPVYQEGTDEVIGMLFAGANKHEQDYTFRYLLYNILLTIVVIGGLAAFVNSKSIRSIHWAISSNIRVLNRMAYGDLNAKTSKKARRRKDELGDMTGSVKRLRFTLKRIVANAKSCTTDLEDASKSLSITTAASAKNISGIEKAVEDIATGASSQAEETQRATKNVNTISDVIKNTVTKTAQLSANSEQMKNESKEALNILNELKEINTKTQTAINEIYAQTNTTNESAQRIEEAVQIIASIASQTNLLSLNASIEAARAGEMGRGFAVVAGEIQNLAEQSNASAETIRQIVASLIADSDSAVKTMQEVKAIVEQQNAKVDKTGELFTKVGQNIDTTASDVQVISSEAKALEEARVAVEEVLQSLSAISEENAASAEETSASMTEVSQGVEQVAEASQHLKELSNMLDTTMSVFTL